MSENANALDRVFDLAEAVCDEKASPNDLAELDAMVMADEASRHDYWEYCRMHIALEMEMRARRAVQRVQQRGDSAAVTLAPWESEALLVALPADGAVSRTPIVSVSPGAMHPATDYFLSGWPVAYLVATVVFGFGLIVGALVHVSQSPQLVSLSSPLPSTHLPAAVGQITGMVDCVWEGAGFRVQGSGAANQKSLVHLGDRLALRSGLLEITYNTGAKVILQGPVTYEVESKNGGFLSIGKLTGKVELDAAKGFFVRTPTATVTDLGTEFGVEVALQAQANVYVFNGSVSIASHTHRYNRIVKAGEAVHIDSETIDHIVSADTSISKHFVRTIRTRPPTWCFIETVPVGNANNAADALSGYGAVPHAYRIGANEVTAGQYTVFLNAKAKADPHGLYHEKMAAPMMKGCLGCNIQRMGVNGSYTYSVGARWANRPVNYVSALDAARFVNWLHNGQGNGDTESGAYNNLAQKSLKRSPDAKFFLPSENEWYKAAYYDPGKPGYWAYPTRSDDRPACGSVYALRNNANALLDGVRLDAEYGRMIVGAFQASASAFGTFDQGGNVWEWTEGAARGGSFDDGPWKMAYNERGRSDRSYEDYNIGFRVACTSETGQRSAGSRQNE